MCFEKARNVGLDIYGACARFKEIPFLNKYVSKSPCLEKAGNFFFKHTIGFICASKDIEIKDHKVDQITPSHSYRNHHLLKLVLAILALPIGLILGSIFKGASFIFSAKTRENHAILTNDLKDTNKVKDNTQIYQDLGILGPDQEIMDLFSNEIAPCQNFPRGPLKHAESTQAHIDAMKAIARLLKEENIPVWLDAGTCLGAYRYANKNLEGQDVSPIIPWDPDLDMGILQLDFENVKHILRRLDPSKYEVQDWSSYDRPGTLLKVRVKGGDHIDLYCYKLNAQRQEVKYIFSHKHAWIPEKWKVPERKQTVPTAYETLFPLKKIYFDGEMIPVPGQIQPWLQRMYGEDLRPAKVWNETTQQYDRVEGHPYWAQGGLH